MAKQDIEQRDFDKLISVIGSEIEHSGVKVVVAANAQMLLHYWRIGYIISYFQRQLGWGGKVIDNISQRLKMEYPEKKGYSPRSLKYMCQFAKQYNADMVERITEIDRTTTFASIEETATSVRLINEAEFGQEAPAPIANAAQDIEGVIAENLPALIAQELPAQLEKSV